ncbi:MAG: alpha/beta hydrolase [Kurthia sp.]|nr:alpha/beta hydrolase [Candidatus Kurthia equi]
MVNLSRKMRIFIDEEKSKGAFKDLTPEEKKDWFVSRMSKEPVDVHINQMVNRKIPTRDGESISAHIIHPNNETKRPAILFFGGGLFLTSDTRHLQNQLAELAVTCNSTVIAVDYRMEKFPTPIEDCIDAVRWVEEHALEFDSKPDHMVLCGDGFGASVVAAATQQLKDSEHSIKAICLFYPAVDPALQTESKRDYGENYLLETSWLNYFYDQMRGTQEVTPISAPLHGTNFDRHPPTYILKAEFDPLRDEGKLYGDKLAEAGVKVFTRVEENTIHGFFSLPGIHLKKSRQIIHDVDHFLKSL